MGFLDDLGGLLGDLREIGQEVEGYKDEALGVVRDFITDTTETVEQTGQDLKETVSGFESAE